MEPIFGDRAEEFIAEIVPAERPALRGEVDFLDVLGAALPRYGVTLPVEEVFTAIWHSITLVPGTAELLRALREAGYGVHLGTNQTARRAAYMRSELGYDDLFDVSCYSCELRLAKPDPAYFAAAAELIGAPAERILFVDDNADNVEGARAAGMAAVHWRHDQGHTVLLERLARHGVVPAAA